MAAVWLAMMVFSLGVLLVGSVKLPTASPLVQEGPLGKETGASAPVAPQKWEWRTTGEGGHEQLLAARQKEDIKVVSKKSSVAIEGPLKKDVPVPTTADGISTSGLTQKGNISELPNATLSPVPFGKAPQETGNTNSKEVLHVKSPKHRLPSPAPKSGQDGGKGLPVVETQSPSPALPLANKTPNVSPAEAGIVSTVTEHWPWLEDQTSATFQELKEGVDVSTATPRLQSTSSATQEWPWLGGKLSASSQTSMDDFLDVSTATLKGATDAHQPRLKPKGNYGVSHPKVLTTPKGVWSWLDEVSTPSSTWAGNSDVSTETPGQTSATEKTTSRGRIISRLGPTTVHRRKTATATTSPSTASPRANSSLLGQCLLAVSLFGLVAAIFIVITAVLAALLWRQKRAYQRRSQQPTEMVCISSLLATEEADEARKRQPRVKRVKMLGDTNGFETEMDNLTLNSFLPEH